jgi:hypothetical protein
LDVVAHRVFGGTLASSRQSRSGQSRGFGTTSRRQAVTLCAAASLGLTGRRLTLFSAARLSIFGWTPGRASSRWHKKDEKEKQRKHNSNGPVDRKHFGVFLIFVLQLTLVAGREESVRQK